VAEDSIKPDAKGQTGLTLPESEAVARHGKDGWGTWETPRFSRRTGGTISDKPKRQGGDERKYGESEQLIVPDVCL
jgi:hypothetical protein